jgi:hypothetical protein
VNPLRSLPPVDSRTEAPTPVWISLAHAAVLIDTTAKALAMRLARTQLPPGIVTKMGRRVLVNRLKFLAWVELGCEGA